MSGRVHAMKSALYEVELLMNVNRNVEKKTYKQNEMIVVFSAWCSKCYAESF